MKTNLKKAISAVSALALASSLAPATFAAKLTLSDVADTASYATAVNTLVALNVINGYEDGTFLPDNLITRAEATKVMVAALNQLDAAEGMKGSTQFTDVEAKHEWATGFINAGVQAGYINGMGDGTFAPDANVTYAQMIKMLVSSMGYDEYATFMGGYPNGYLSIANSEGVTTGVKANANDNVTRAQVAQLVYNALTTPVVENTGMEWTSDGKLVPTIAKMNGQNDNKYKTLLTEKFDAYYVEGYVTETSKGGALKNDEVKFGIAKSEKYDNTDFGLESFASQKNVQSLVDVVADPARIVTVNVGETDAADYEGVYAAAIIMVDEYDDLVILSFQPSGKNKTFKFDAKLVDEDEYDGKAFSARTENYLYIFATDSATKSSKYNLQKKDNGDLDVKIYVNGFAMDTDTDAKTRALIDKYVIDAAVGDIELVDTYKTDGYYDTIYVNSYVTAQVDSITASTKKITFKNSTIGAATLTLDEDVNEDLVYNIYYNGEKVALTDLKKDDVLSIAYNVGDGSKTAFANSDHYDIYVSRTVETGKLGGMSASDEVVTIGGTEYDFVDSYASATKDFKLGDEYTIYVDYFGRIYKSEINVSSAKYAVVDKFIYNSSDEDYRLTLFTAEGETKTLTFDSSKATVYADGKAVSGVSTKAEKQNYILAKVYNNGSSAAAGRKAIEDRVVKYKVSTSSGRVTEIDFLTAANSTVSSEEVTKANYKASTGAIGSVKVGDATKIIDAIKYSSKEDADYTDLAIASKASLADDTAYRAYGYGDKIDGYHPFVLICEGAGAYNADSRYAVIADSITDAQDDAGADIYKIPALYFKSGEENDAVKELIGNDELNETKVKSLNVGDVIMFQLDANGYIDEFDVIFSLSSDGVPEYDALVAKSIVENNDTALFANGVIALPNKDDRSEDWVKEWAGYSSSVTEPIQLVYGPVVTKNDNSFGVAKIAKETDNTLYTDLNKSEKEDGGVYEIDLASSTAVYEYDYSQSKKNRLSVGTAASIRASSFSESNLVDNDYIPWNLEVDGETPNLENVNFAFVLVVDGTARDVLVFNAK